MGSGEPLLTIVALPCEDDPVNRYSSEEMAHMTIMVMAMPEPDVYRRILEFVGHAVNTTLCKFWMDVKGRGELGENKADVLFLKGYNQKALDEFRTYLLTNPDIRKAYDATEQYDRWLPHLTMGYPKTPAKSDDREYPGFHSVGFDRIAVWTGEYFGPEIQLDDNYAYDGEVRMSDTMALGAEVLEHYGIKGMHWGVRRERVKTGGRRGGGESTDSRSARDAGDKARRHGVRSLSNAEIRALNERQGLERQYANWRRDQKVLHRGHEQIKTGMAFLGTAGAIYTFYQSPFGKAAVRTGTGLVKRFIKVA